MAERMLHMLEPENWTSDVDPETSAPVSILPSARGARQRRARDL